MRSVLTASRFTFRGERVEERGEREPLLLLFCSIFILQQEGPQLIDIGGAAGLVDDGEFGFAADGAGSLQPRGKVGCEAGCQGFVCVVQRRTPLCRTGLEGPDCGREASDEGG